MLSLINWISLSICWGDFRNTPLWETYETTHCNYKWMMQFEGKRPQHKLYLQHLIMKRLQGPSDGYCVLHCEMANFFFKGQRVGMFSSTRDCRKQKRNGIFPSAYSVTPSCAVKIGTFDLATSYAKCQRSCQPCWFDIWHKESCLFRSEFTNFQLPS